jgi:hypothetical protein
MLVSPAARSSKGMSLFTVVEVGQTETALDSGQLLGEKQGRGFRLVLTGNPQGTRLAALTTTVTAPNFAARSAGGHSRHLGRLIHVHQGGHGVREAGLHSVERPQSISVLG